MTAAVRSARTRKPAVKKERFITLLTLLDTGAGIFQVREGKETDRYFFSPQASDYGTAFTVEKWADASETEPAGLAEAYHVNLDGKRSSCECKGFLRWGHCRHIEGLSALCESGKLVCRKPARCQHRDVFQSDGDEIVCADCGATL